VTPLEFSLSCEVQNKKDGFAWKLVVVYGPPYEERKAKFIKELHLVLAGWQGPILVGGDFNLNIFCSDKSNGKINQKFADCFNDWINKWGMDEINPCNRKFTWSNNQLNHVMAKLDRFFAFTSWICKFPLSKVSCLLKDISDHTPTPC
jgi:hypothetical protein